MEADYATNLRPRISGMPCLCAFPDFYFGALLIILRGALFSILRHSSGTLENDP